jgi:mono/diheme cytochrome c family protein
VGGTEHRSRQLKTLLKVGMVALLSTGSPALAAAPVSLSVRRDDIQAILEVHCLKCHGPEKQKGGLRLDNPADAFKGGDSGERGIVPGESGRSRVFQMVSSK